MINIKVLLRNHQAVNVLRLSVINVLVIIFLLYIAHTSSSLALAAFTYLNIFDLLNLITVLVSIWVKYQVPTPAYPYGYKRCEVLAIFSTVILTILGAFFALKESAESLFETKEINTSFVITAGLIGFLFHILITLFIRNDSFDYVIKSSSSSWLQEQVFDISESLCRYVPGLSKVLLPRVNPFVLIGAANLFVLICSNILIDMGSSYLVDTYACIAIAIMLIGTMLPFALYTGKILLQTTPSHLVTQLDKTLREAATLDGVLEFRDEHFWTLSFGVLVGSLHVRIRRDADEQLVLAHVWNKLAGLVQVLTVHIFKDDWIRRTTHQLVYNQNYMPYQPPVKPMPPPSTTQSNLSVNTSVSDAGNASLSSLSHSFSTRPGATFANAQLELKTDNDYVLVNN